MLKKKGNRMIDLDGIETFMKQGASRKVAQGLKKDISQLTVEVRSKHNLSQRALADMFEVRQATVSRWEMAQSVPRPWEVKRLFDLFHSHPSPEPKERGWGRPSIGSAKMNIRDQFAAAALTGLLSNPKLADTILKHGGAEGGWVEENAYAYADAMMKAREAK
jgi:DNA-binding transcriptional regulator YiaG